MLKVLIADDEPKIRRGLRNLLEWEQMGMEVVGEAEDGEIALEMVRSLSPDILLVDICMPFLNGLQLVEEVKTVLSDCRIIIITGHDEFEYAQKALKLRVFDYIMKPVSRDQLHSVILNAKNELLEAREQNKYVTWANRELNRHFPVLRERFLNDFVNNHLTHLETEEQMDFLGINLTQDSGVILVKLLERPSIDEVKKEWDRHLLLFAMQNIFEELLQEWQGTVFKDNKSNLVAITPIKQLSQWMELGHKFEAAVDKYLGQSIIVCQEEVSGGVYGIPVTYEKLVNEINEKGNFSPVILLAQKYIEENYHKENLSLQEVAEVLKLSPTYLSRLLKNNVGHTFIDLLTKIRINMAIKLMNDPTMKIYEVAERVGYSTQHYFSTAFKKVLGVSPLEYRKGGLK